MNKKYIVSLLVVLSLVLTGMANAASTIGTNMSTTGTFAQTVSSATAALFQNAAGTLTVLQVDTTTGTGRVGVGAAPSTTFEVQGTASASFFFTQNTLQVAGVPGATATVAYSRFGVGTTGNTVEFNAANDLLITGSLEVDGKASVAGNFQTSGRFIADTAASHSFKGDLILTSDLIVRGTVTSQSSGLYTAEFGGGAGTATISLLFGSSTASSLGTCFQMKNTVGDWVYARILGTTWTVNYVKCHSTQ